MGHNYTLFNGETLAPKLIRIWQNDCTVEYHGHANPGHKPPPRGDVCEFTDASRARLAFVANNTAVTFFAMITLTYPRDFPSDGKQVKAQLRALLMRAGRRWRPLEYLWFIEWQRRGAPHFHILVDVLPTREGRDWLSMAWFEIVNSSDPKHLLAGTQFAAVKKPNGLRRYVVKYASKMAQKTVPAGYTNVGRFWGHSKAVKPIEMAQPIPVHGADDLKHKCRTWSHAAALDKPLSTLYNAAVDVMTQRVIDNNETGS